jgi:hypothetical protein
MVKSAFNKGPWRAVGFEPVKKNNRFPKLIELHRWAPAIGVATYQTSESFRCGADDASEGSWHSRGDATHSLQFDSMVRAWDRADGCLCSSLNFDTCFLFCAWIPETPDGLSFDVSPPTARRGCALEC